MERSDPLMIDMIELPGRELLVHSWRCCRIASAMLPIVDKKPSLDTIFLPEESAHF